MYVCICNAITEKDVLRCIEEGARTPADLIHAFNLDNPGSCGRCPRRVDQWLADDAAEARDCSAMPGRRDLLPSVKHEEPR